MDYLSGVITGSLHEDETKGRESEAYLKMLHRRLGDGKRLKPKNVGSLLMPEKARNRRPLQSLQEARPSPHLDYSP